MFKYVYRLIFGYIAPVIHVLGRTYTEYQRDQVFRLGAALAYYTIFSLPAILIVVTSLVGLFLGEAAVAGQIYEQIAAIAGESAAHQIENAVKNIGSYNTNWWATIVGFVLLIFGATGVFYALQDALNIIYGVYRDRRKGYLQMVINRLLSFGMVLGIGFVLVTSFMLNSIALYLNSFILDNKVWLESQLVDSNYAFLLPYLNYFTNSVFFILNIGVSFIVFILFFSLLYKVLPDAKLKWRFIFPGAILTTILFYVGKILMEFYISQTGFTTAYGAAGSLIVILIWVYYSSQLVFLGAEFIKVLSQYKGFEIEPKAFANRMINFAQLRSIRNKVLYNKEKGKTSKAENKKD